MIWIDSRYFSTLQLFGNKRFNVAFEGVHFSFYFALQLLFELLALKQIIGMNLFILLLVIFLDIIDSRFHEQLLFSAFSIEIFIVLRNWQMSCIEDISCV